ncbi:MAG: putative ATPase [Deltaproteobacteria bacterium]|nr:putative ATPase [Deltaproteobacteria bacterium]MBP2687884.1 putative ATPase [Deltaproteobacteria bacterium]
MSMVITCESCASRFRFNEELLKGAAGALIKCPRCSERILVRNPAAPRVASPLASRPFPRDTPPIDQRISPRGASPRVFPPKLPPPAPPAAVDTNVPPIQAEGKEGKASLAPPNRHAAGADLSLMVGSGSVSPEIPGKYAQGVADLFRSPSEAEAGGSLSGGDDSSREHREAGQARKVPSPRPLYQHPLFIAAAILLLLLSGGAFYYVHHVDGSAGRKTTGPVIPLQSQGPPGQPIFDVQNLKGHINEQATGERLYVIKGTVTNVGKSLSRGVRIQATLLGKDNEAIMQNESFAGNLIDESLMSHMNRVRIEGFLGMRYGEGNANRDIPVGMSLPFMVVFFDPPGGIQAFTVKAMDVGEAERIQSPDAEKTDTRVSPQQSTRLH